MDALNYDDEGYSSEESLNTSLNLADIPFFGRDNELLRLNGIYNELRDKKMVSVSLICGHSGAGKSALVHKFIEDLKLDTSDANNPHCIVGKYCDCLGITSNPFSAIIEALGGLFSSVNKENLREFERIRSEVLRILGPDEVETISSLIPSFNQIPVSGFRRRSSTISTMAADANIVSSGGTDIPRQIGGWNRLKYIFQTLFQIICTKKHPLVIFLDDLQCADDASLALIDSLLTDKSISCLMFVGAIQATEVEEESPLSKALESLAKARKIERMNVENLTIKETGHFLAKVLHLSPIDTADLGIKIFDKTLGNFFFVTQTLQDLKRSDVLYYSHISFRWEWDIDKVETGPFNNVLDTVVLKLQSIPERSQQALTIAAYTRSTFDLNTITKLMKDLAYLSDFDDLSTILNDALSKCLLSYNTETEMYTFSHDRIKKAACLLVPSGEERQNLQAALGTCLWHMGAADDGEDWMLFVAADHLNGNKSANIDPIFLMDVNLLVGQTALVMSAYTEASFYLEKGIELLKQIDRYWEERYDLSLQLFQAYASAELYRGHIDKGGVIAHIVLKNAKDLRDQLPIFLTLAVVFGQMEHHKESLRLSCNVLKKLNAFPSYVYGVRNFLWLRSFFRNNTDDDILQLQRMKDDVKIITMKFIGQAIIRAFHISKRAIMAVLAVRGIQITLKYGLCGESALCLSIYAQLIIKKQYERSLRLTHLAHKILDQGNAQGVGGWTLVSSASIILRNDNNHAKIMSILQQGYRYGMESGDIEVAIASRVAAINCALVSGYSLLEVNKSIDETIEQSLFYNVKSQREIIMEYKLTHFLTKRDIPNFKDLGCFAVEGETCSKLKLGAGCVLRIMLGVHFGEYAFARTMTKMVSLMTFHFRDIQILRWSYSFFMAAGLARQTGKSKYRTMAKKIAKLFTRFPKSSTCIHQLMKAQLVATKVKLQPISTVQLVYDQAIIRLLKAGFIQYVGLGCDFAGEYFLSMNKTDLAGKYFSQAKLCYKEWGARALESHMEHKMRSCMPHQTSSSFISENFQKNDNPGLLSFYAYEQSHIDLF